MIRALACLLIWSGTAEAACRQALALGFDMSTSVDASEYRLQIEGLASALQSDAVQDVLFAQPDAPIHIAVYEWSGPPNQTLILPWTALQTPADLTAAVRIITDHQRVVAAPTTAIGAALLYGFALLEARPDCWKRTLDLSGDGETNTGPRPEDIAPERAPPGVTVNALVIGSGNSRGDDHRFADIKALSAYYERNVVRGPGAFVEDALGFEDYAAAMERKLLRELSGIAVGQLSGGHLAHQ